MKKYFVILFLVLFQSFGCGSDVPGKGPKDVVFAYADGDGIYVISGDGSLNQKVTGGYYYQAALSPDKTKVACVYDKDFQITIFSLDSNFETHLKPKTVFNSQALAQGSKMTSVACPVWSPDGQKIYFLNLNHLIVYDYQEQKTTSLFDFPENQSAGQTNDTGIMRLSKDGDSLDCMLSEGQDKLAFWTVSIGSNQGSAVAETSRDLLGSFKFPPELSENILENLFGSRENPVLGPIHSPDRRYYFYFQKGEGFLAHHGIKGYDRTTKEIFDVTTLSTSLYAQ